MPSTARRVLAVWPAPPGTKIRQGHTMSTECGRCAVRRADARIGALREASQRCGRQFTFSSRTHESTGKAGLDLQINWCAILD